MKSKKILLIRSGFLGDFLVILPGLYLFLEQRQLTLEDVKIIVINSNGSNPVEFIFGKENILSKNSFVVRNTNLFTYIKELFKFRVNNKYSFKEIHYLNFAVENKRKLIKIIPFYFLWPFVAKKGFKTSTIHSNSHYLSPFFHENLSYLKLPSINLFEFFFLELNKSFSNHLNYFKEDKKTIIIAVYPNSKVESKKWPQENFVELIKYLLNNLNAKVYLIGSPEDSIYNEEIIDSLKNINTFNISNIAGKLDVFETLTLFKTMSLLITNDGFPMHLGAFVQCPTLAFFTYREKTGAWEPFFNNKFLSLKINVSCKECYDFQCSNAQCVIKVPVIHAINAVHELISTNNINQSRVLNLSNPMISNSTY